MMESRRFTMSNPTAAFSMVAHEALDHIVLADGENDDCISQEGGLLTHQRSRRRLRVSQIFLYLFMILLDNLLALFRML
jgi:hypothetical protein